MLLLEPVPTISTPNQLLPEIILRAVAVVPPIKLFDEPDPTKMPVCIPLDAVPLTSSVPVISVPI